MTTCYICEIEFQCSCEEESFISPHKRSCAVNGTFPYSKLHTYEKHIILIHICSKTCDKKYRINVDKEEDEYMTTELGYEKITRGEYTMYYDPKTQSKKQAMKKLMKTIK